MINARCQNRQMHLRTNLHAIAVSVTLHRTIRVCSINIPPGAKIEQKDLDEIINQLLTPYLL